MISVGGTNEISDSRSPLQVVAESLNAPLLKTIITIGASTAKHGVLLSHILCISRIMLAMGRRNDLTPVIIKFIILVTGLIIMVLTIIGSFEFMLGSAAFPLSFNVILTGDVYKRQFLLRNS